MRNNKYTQSTHNVDTAALTCGLNNETLWGYECVYIWFENNNIYYYPFRDNTLTHTTTPECIYVLDYTHTCIVISKYIYMDTHNQIHLPYYIHTSKHISNRTVYVLDYTPTCIIISKYIYSTPWTHVSYCTYLHIHIYGYIPTHINTLQYCISTGACQCKYTDTVQNMYEVMSILIILTPGVFLRVDLLSN